MKNANAQALNKLLATGTKNSRGDEPCSIYLMHVAVFVCRRSRLSPFWLTSSRHVAVLVSPFSLVAVLVCRRFDCTPSVRYDTVHLTCSEKLTGSQLSHTE